MAKTALGKGLEGLIPTGFDIANVAEPGESIKHLNINDIEPNPDQPRKHFDEQSLQELAKSIKEHGVLQPLIVTPKSSNGKYRIIAGERRFRASQLASLNKIPAIIRDHKELEELEIALVENVQRVDLSPLETAISIVKLRDQFSLTPKQIADKLGKAETTVSNIIRLLQLPKQAIEALQNNSISEGHARAILALKNDPKKQIILLKMITESNISVRDAEEYVRLQKKNIEQKSSSNNKNISPLLNGFKKRGLSFKIQEKKNGGNIIINYKNESELEKILNLFNAE